MVGATLFGMGLEEQLNGVIDQLSLPELAKQLVRSRWLDQVLWMEEAAAKQQKRYYWSRAVSLVVGAAVPPLIGLKVDTYITVVLSLLVTVAASLEAFFRYGERWRHYRQSVEALKIEGYQFFQLCGPYQSFADHGAAFSQFAGRVEDIMQKEVETYITQVAQELPAAKGTGAVAG